MPQDLALIALTAAAVGGVHTLLGPDHYLPFIVLARARQWTVRKTLGITLMCGVGHVLGSLVLGLVGIALGVTVSRLQALESHRGEILAWILIASGLVYLAWGLRRAYGFSHGHGHSHGPNPASLAPWALFMVFVLGPCEPMIPLLLYPAASESWWKVVVVAVVFTAVTLATMAGVVLAGIQGTSLLPLARLERYGDAVAGGVIVLCGLGIRFLGW